jgi:hypothetical protein
VYGAADKGKSIPIAAILRGGRRRPHCEAYTAIVRGRLLSRERYHAAEAEAVDRREDVDGRTNPRS